MMNNILNLGKWVFILPFTIFGILHIINADQMTSMVPAYFSGGSLWVYLTGFAQLAFAVSVVLGKYDKLAAVLCAVMLLIFILTLHFPGLSNLQMSKMAMNNMLKDLGLIGGAMMYGSRFANDKRIIG
jgi:putative oxidoreductase